MGHSCYSSSLKLLPLADILTLLKNVLQNTYFVLDKFLVCDSKKALHVTVNPLQTERGLSWAQQTLSETI